MTVNLAARIREQYGDLSPQEQRAADFLREHLADLAVYNATEVARLSGVSKATVSRLYRRLGFESAEELRTHVRGLRSRGEPIAGDTPATFAAHLEQEVRNLTTALAGFDVTGAARLIARARRVLVVGFRNSYPLALHLRQQLAQARPSVELAPLPGQSIGEELAGLTAEDVVVLVGFRRRPAHFADLVSLVHAGAARSVLLTDAGHLHAGSRHAGSVHAADEIIECPVDSVSAFDSYAAAASVVSVLAAAVLDANLREGRSRVSAISEAYAELGELEA